METIRPFEEGDRQAVIALWSRCGLVVPQNDPNQDINHKFDVNPEWFLVAVNDGEVIGTCMAGYDGHRGWINYLGVDPDHRRTGVATGLMEEAERQLRAAGCPKINLQVRTHNTAVITFYENLGFGKDAVIGMGKRLT